MMSTPSPRTPLPYGGTPPGSSLAGIAPVKDTPAEPAAPAKSLSGLTSPTKPAETILGGQSFSSLATKTLLGQ